MLDKFDGCCRQVLYLILFLYCIMQLKNQPFVAPYAHKLGTFFNLSFLLPDSPADETKTADKGRESMQRQLLRKMRAMDIKVYGSLHCPWSTQQLAELGIDDTSEVYVNCDTNAGGCTAVEAFPSWRIGGKMKAGFMRVEQASEMLDTLLLAQRQGSDPIAPKQADEALSAESAVVKPTAAVVASVPAGVPPPILKTPVASASLEPEGDGAPVAEMDVVILKKRGRGKAKAAQSINENPQDNSEPARKIDKSKNAIVNGLEEGVKMFLDKHGKEEHGKEA